MDELKNEMDQEKMRWNEWLRCTYGVRTEEMEFCK